MDAWRRLYEAPAVMTPDWGHHRIYAPAAYKIVRTLSLVPIVHTEVLGLATHFPTCWAMVEGELTLCMLRSLLDDGLAMPGGMRVAKAVLPLAFQAYPIVVPHQESPTRQTVAVDRAIADEPSDIGAPLILSNGQLGKATIMRVQIALEAGRALPATRAISCFLHDSGLLEPWPLQFDLGGGMSVDIQHLMVLASSQLDDPQIYRAIEKFGVNAALFLSAHRLSLFRTAGLLAAAKAMVQSRPAERRQEVAA
jgi:hypothetical protein